MESKDLLLLLWRNIRFLIAGLVLGVALGFAATKIQTPVYEAKTQILISRSRQQSNTDMLPLGEDQLISTNVQLAKSQPVLDAVSAKLGSKVKVDNIQVAAISNTLIIQIRAQDPNPQRAANIANTLVQVLIQQNQEMVAARYTDFESRLNDQIDQLQKQIRDLQGQISQINDASIAEQLAQVNKEIDRLNTEIAALEKEINSYPVLLNDKQKIALGQQQAQLEQLRTRLNLYQQIQTNLTFIGKPGQTGVSREDPRLNSLQSTLNLYQELYLSLVNNRETINLDRMQNTPNITQIDPAQPPKAPIRPMPLLYVLLASVIGLFLSATAILTFDYFDDTLKSSEKVQEVLGIRIIGKIAESHHISQSHEGTAISVRDNSALQNAFGTLRINVSRLMAQQSVKAVLIASPARGDGKTTIAVNLGVAFARSGKKVILLDADLAHPQLHARLKLDNETGLTSILAENIEWKETTQKYDGITVITGGPSSSSSAQLLESDAMTELLEDLRSKFDVVIVDGPPLFLMEAQILAAKIGGIVMVVRQGDTLTAVARAMLDQLNLMDANVLGAVLNCVPQKQSYYFEDRVEHTGKKISEPLTRPRTHQSDSSQAVK